MIVAKKRIYLTILIALLIFALICGIFIGIENKYIVYADEISVEENELVHDSVSNSVNEVDYNINNENYHYSQQEAEFEIVNADGSIAIDDCIIVNYGNVSVELPMFDYYRVLDYNGNVRFFQADTLKDEYIEKFAFVGLYLPSIDFDIDKYTFVVQYFSNNKLFNITVLLDSNRVEFFDSISIDLILDDGEVSSRLKEAVRIQSKGKVVSSEELVNKTEIKALNSIAPKSYDTYTNTDGIIRAYPTSYFGQYIKNGLIGDDPIVRIVPKELMFIAGQHTYVGKQYGFFINTVKNASGNDNYADVLVFDIFHRTPVFSTGEAPEGIAKVVPMFQYRYKILENVGGKPGFISTLNSVVYPHTHYDAPNYCLSNIGFKVSLSNPTKKNVGDYDYNDYNDDGAFIIQTRYNAKGIGVKKCGGNFLSDTLNFALGFVPHVGTILDTAQYVYNVYNGFGNGGYLYSNDTYISNNEVNIRTGATNNTDQIEMYGHLIKAVSAKLTPDDSSPRMIDVNGGYSELIYVVARRSGSIYNRIHVITSTSVNIVEDNTTGSGAGSIYNYGNAVGTYSVSADEFAGDFTNDITKFGHTSKNFKAGSNCQIVRFAPKFSGKYLLRTEGLYSPKVAVCDVNSETGYIALKSRTIEMVNNHTYYLEIMKTNNDLYDYTFHLGYSPEATYDLYPSKNVSVSASSNVIYSFTPICTAYCDIYTELTSGDPYLILLDSNGVMLDYNDDSNGRDAKIRYKFDKDSTYYIVAQGYYGGAATFKLVEGLPQATVDTLFEVSHMPTVFEFNAPYSGNYYIYSDFVTDYVGAALLEIYDENNVLLASDSYGRGNANHAAIAIFLTSTQTYTIRAWSVNYEYAHYGLMIKSL